MLHAILQCPAHDCLAVDDTVGLGNNASIDGAGLMAARCTMILGGIGDDVDFCLTEPLAQPAVLAHDACTVGVMLFASVGEPQVMIGSCNE